jgi:hypothetical protein
MAANLGLYEVNEKPGGRISFMPAGHEKEPEWIA